MSLKFRPPALFLLATGLVFGVLAACTELGPLVRHRGDADRGEDPAPGRLRARPQTHLGRPLSPGVHELPLGVRRAGVVYVPRSYRRTQPSPLVVMLHGAGGAGRGAIRPFLKYADAAGAILLAPDSRRATWDVAYGGFGPDAEFTDRALRFVFGHFRIDPQRIAIEGFSDGASYALSLGLVNGDLFRRIVAFSPGFVSDGERHGMPAVFVSHGVDDPTLPIRQTSREIVPTLRDDGYSVRYIEFDGKHEVPRRIARAAFDWLAFDHRGG